MTAFQIQVVGALDGSTLFVPPTPIPQPVQGGVVKMTAAGAAGIFDIASLIGWQGPALMSCFHVEYAVATIAARANIITPGQVSRPTPPAGNRFIPDQERIGATGILMRPYTFFKNAYLPPGAQIAILTDNTSLAFGGAAVAGPHFIFFDIQPLQIEGDIARAEAVCNAADAKQKGGGGFYSSFQAVAASASEDVFIADQDIDVPGREYQIDGVLTVSTGAAAAAGESMSITAARIRGGVASILATALIDNTLAANGVLQVALAAQAGNNFARGDRLRIARTYVAGGGPTPMTNTIAQVQVRPIAFN